MGVGEAAMATPPPDLVMRRGRGASKGKGKEKGRDFRE